MSGWLTNLRDRRANEQERRSARMAVLAVLLATVVLLTLTHSTSPIGRPQTANVSPPAANIWAPGAQRLPFNRSALRVGKKFLSGYLAYSYGRASAAVIDDASGGLLASLETARSRASLAMRARQPRILALTPTTTSTGQVEIIASVTDGGIVHYTLDLSIGREHGRLVVTGLDGKS